MKTIHWRYGCKVCTALLLTAGAAGSAWSDIVVAQVAPMSHPVAVEGKETNIGIRIAIDAANARQEIAGQKIILQTEDDNFDPQKTVALVRKLAKSDVLALLDVVGSPAMAKLLQERVLEATEMPVIGVIPGAESLRKPSNPYVFHIRASDNEQYRKLIRNALTIGLNRIAVVYLDTPPVKAGVDAMEAILAEASLAPVARIAIAPKANVDHSDAMKVLKAANPQLVLLALPGQLAGEFIKTYVAYGMRAQITSLSYGNPDTICKVATQEKSRGISVAQILPSTRNTALPLVRQFNEDFHVYGPKDERPNAMQFEGYISAKVLIEGLKRISGPPTRKKLVKALDTMQRVNLGGYVIDFSPVKHTGSDFVEIGVLTNGCTVVY